MAAGLCPEDKSMSGSGLQPWQVTWDERGDSISTEFALRRTHLPGGRVRIRAHDFAIQMECHKRETDAAARAINAAIRSFMSFNGDIRRPR